MGPICPQGVWKKAADKNWCKLQEVYFSNQPPDFTFFVYTAWLGVYVPI